MKRTRLDRWGALVAAVAAASTLACAKEVEHAARPVPVRAQVVEGSSSVGGRRYSAVIRPDVQVDLAFKVTGYIESILEVRGADGRPRAVQEGDAVARGTVLARVRDGEYRDRVEEARSSLTKARGDFERAAQLYERRTVSKADYDAAAAQLTASQARMSQAEIALEDCALRATLDGWVMGRSIEVGSLVSPGTPGFVVADTRSVKAVVGVPDVVVGDLRLGQTETVRCEAIPSVTFTGTITRIAPSADATSRVFEVECTIPNRDGRIRSGMIASLELGEGGAPSAGARVPLNAIVRPPGDPTGYAVFVVEEADGKTIARSRRVELGDVAGNEIGITSGLAPGERVIMVGATLVVDSQEVTIIP
jgi:RND family efflux transporter MFP subunit